jgi:beta-lactamase class A
MQFGGSRAAVALALIAMSCPPSPRPRPSPRPAFPRVDTHLQQQLEQIDERLRTKYAIAADQTDVGLLDLEHDRVAMIHPDHEEYAASVAKVGILYAWFALGHDVDAQTQHELGLMIKASSNEMAAKYSRIMGLTTIQQTLNAAGFYDAKHGGGIWVGKHYGAGGERYGDPIANHSHAVTVRQLLRFYQLLDRNELVSPAASRTMREIFLSPDIPHDDHKFVKGLHGRGLTILRKWGTWEDWLHDSAIIEGPNRRYVLVGLTHHPNGDAYLEELASEVDDLMGGRTSRSNSP